MKFEDIELSRVERKLLLTVEKHPIMRKNDELYFVKLHKLSKKQKNALNRLEELGFIKNKNQKMEPDEAAEAMGARG